MTSVLFLTSGRRQPSSRFRVGQYLDLLRADGWRADVAPCIPDKFAVDRGWIADAAMGAAKVVSRGAGILRAARHDLVYLERELLPVLAPHPERLLRRLHPRIVFDLDDAIWLNHGARSPNPVVEIASMARAVIAGNEYLASWARRRNPAVAMIPTAIDTERYRPSGRRGDGRLLVWTGSSSTLPYLESMASVLAAAARLHPGLRLRIVCDRRPSRDPGLPVEFVPWAERVEVEAVRTADIGIMPLPDTEWARGKCGYKLLQYMACGLPSVASRWGVAAEMLGEELCGLAVDGGWVQAIDRLAGSPELRSRLGGAARERAEALYSRRVLYPRWRSVLESALDDRIPPHET